MSNNKYWQSLEQLEETPAFKEQAAKEFQEELPVFDFVDDTTKVESTGRRDFLKMMGFSISAAAIASSCKIPVKKAVPYVFSLDQSSRIPELVPGVADYFASSYAEGGDFSSILVKTRENRPIKIEGNTAAPLTQGSTTARAQASVLGLYDVARLTQPKKKGESITWEKADAEISDKLAKIAAAGGKIVILSNTNYSLVTKKALETFKAKFPTTEVVTYDPVSLYAIRKANKVSLGSDIIPSYLFDKANIIAGFNCDFLGGWVNTSENAKRYSKNRVPSKENPSMSRHYQFQSNVTITGASADYKYSMKPSEEKAVLIALYNKVAASTGGSTLSAVKLSESLQSGVDKLSKDLLENKGASIVVSGTNNVDIQLLVNAINGLLGSYGSTIDTAAALNLKQGNDEALKALADDTSVKAILLLNANPVYDTPFSEKFKAIIEKAELSVSFSERLDESAELVQYITPDNHYLESWDVLEPKKGFISFVQPTINQLFDTRQAAVTLTELAGSTATAYELAKSVGVSYTTNFPTLLGNSSWESALQTGFVSSVSESASGSASVSASIAAVSTALPKVEGLELVIFESIPLGDGKQSNNPYLQEMPDPITRVSWDNYIALPYTFAINHGIAAMEQASTVKTAKVTVNGKEIVLPVVISYGQAQDTIAIALGYGRSQGVGLAAFGSGENAYPFVTFENGTITYAVSSVSYETLSGTKKIGLSQRYHTLQEDNNLPGRPRRYRPIVKEANLAAFRQNESAGNEDREKIKHHLTTLYKGFDSPGHHWSMAVDLNACIGCGACVMSCNIENNIPVIGRKEMSNTRSMHWIRIDRYYSGNPDNPDVAFQPMMCQHCDNAPCENVCPVNATNHSSEGLNQMAYNRCIGTKYCANNCPFKVRKFNWYDYQGNDAFGAWNDHTDATYMFEDLTRMVLNPDVTVRSRGVIEKCSFCVQRIQSAKLVAKSEGRALKDGDVQTACQSACPTGAITFGDRNDKNSEVHRIFFESGRNYHLYEEQHFLPNVGYQVKIRNTDEEPQFTFIGAKEENA